MIKTILVLILTGIGFNSYAEKIELKMFKLNKERLNTDQNDENSGALTDLLKKDPLEVSSGNWKVQKSIDAHKSNDDK